MKTSIIVFMRFTIIYYVIVFFIVHFVDDFLGVSPKIVIVISFNVQFTQRFMTEYNFWSLGECGMSAATLFIFPIYSAMVVGKVYVINWFF